MIRRFLFSCMAVCAFAAPVFATSITDTDILRYTNTARIAHNRDALIPDSALVSLAEKKLADMFARDYFAHKDPDGLNAATHAKNAQYAFKMLGENLAMGDYEGAEALVDAWMESAGHRENILEGKYTRIGIASGIGEFEGEDTFIAVQIFARPLSSCKAPSHELSAYITHGTSYAKQVSTLMHAYVEHMGDASNSGVRALTNQVSALMTVFLRELDEKVKKYNAEVEAFNDCVDEK